MLQHKAFAQQQLHLLALEKCIKLTYVSNNDATLPFGIIINTNIVEPCKEIWFWFDAVKTGRQLQHVYLCHQLKLLSTFVKVYQTVFR